MHKMNGQRKVSYYAYIMIVISITFLLYGIFLGIGSTHHLIDPVKDVLSSPKEENTVSITTSDGSEVVPGNTVVSDEGDTNPFPPVEDVVVENQQNNDVVEEKTITIDDINNDLRNKIQFEFGVTVLYGKETEGYSVAGVTTSVIEDSNVVQSQLNHLRNTLSLYPKGLFAEIKGGGIPLTILLIDKYSIESVTGVTDSSYSYANISISAAFPFEESFYHESYHYIERYLFKKGANFNSWDSLNPEGFQYGSMYNEYSYNVTFSDLAPFVNNYAQTADTEDRASTFEYMMAPSKASCLNNGNPVWQKALYISHAIEAALNTVHPNTIEYWERYL